MNVICNNCHGSHLYMSVGERLNNQFSWCGIDLKDFVYLASHYDEDMTFCSERIIEALLEHFRLGYKG